MLSAIVQKVTGQTGARLPPAPDLRPARDQEPDLGDQPAGSLARRLRPQPSGPRTSPGSARCTCKKGNGNGKQLVPEAWVEAATARQTSNGSDPASDWDQGYGYQFWRGRHNAYRGDGAFGQYCLVIPDQDTVVAINSGVKDMQAVLNVVWDKLLPAMHPSPLADQGPAAVAQLRARLAGLGMPTVAGSGTTETARKVAGRRFTFPSNPSKVEAITWQAGPTEADAALVVRIDGKESRLPAHASRWISTRAAMGPLTDQPAGSCGAWTSDDTYTAKVAFVETPFLVTLKARFQGDEVTLDTESNVGFGATKQPAVVGKAE